MIAPDKIEKLHAFLVRLPEPFALRLAKAVEVDRLVGGAGLPHDLILDGLRPLLRRALGVTRTPSPKRYFCGPFEDLLCSEARKEKLKGRIARSAINPIWNWLAHTLMPEDLAAYCESMKDAVLGHRPDEALKLAAEFRRQAAQALRTALETDDARRLARLALGGEANVADAREMALLLSVSVQISELQDRLPKPLQSLTEDYVKMLRSIYERVESACPDAAPYVAVVVMNRLERPWEALKLPLMIARQTDDTLISSTDMGLVGEALFGELESHAVFIHSARPESFDAEALARHVSRFALLSNGIVKEVEMRRDGRWGQRLMKDRAAVAEIMDGMMQRAPREVFAALPTLKSGAYAGGPRVPDLSHALDSGKAARALSYAKLIPGSRNFASAASFAASLGAANDEIALGLKSYCDGIVRELRAAEGETRRRIEEYFELAAELTTILFSAEEGEFLRRRGRAATAAQAAA